MALNTETWREPDQLNILTMDYWGGSPASVIYEYRTVPWYVYYIDAPGEMCTTQEECRAQVVKLHTYDNQQVEKCGARYNFVICGDGNVYESRGWMAQPLLPAHYKKNQRIAILLGFIGVKLDFSNVPLNVHGSGEYVVKMSSSLSSIPHEPCIGTSASRLWGSIKTTSLAKPLEAILPLNPIRGLETEYIRSFQRRPSYDDVVQIKTIEEWGGKYPDRVFAYMATPWYVFHMSTNGDPCTGLDCQYVAQRIQITAQRSSPFGGRYNFLIGGDGMVYEMRGWLGQPLLPKAHRTPQNVSLLFGYIGRYETPDEVPEVMKNAALKLLENGKINGWVMKNIVQKPLFSPSPVSVPE